MCQAQRALVYQPAFQLQPGQLACEIPLVRVSVDEGGEPKLGVLLPARGEQNPDRCRFDPDELGVARRGAG